MKDNEATNANTGAGGAAPETAEQTSAPGLDPAIQNALGRELRALYDQVVSEPVPDRFLELLRQLESSEGEDQTQSK